ncbi:uncharacterized protein M421DRAFT_309322 [Didymella exigua CBS 183.55]|uniref:Uncharacterized protein n=1 Tax=Didymella exigua CBS 183.55 TaxID=1150837 RepID=A0A6A5RCV7_9PLEO|nr:uncharacterized protein M421DRAFT_309322 [Didymella exigua CBS 183.55]KAF1923587.1 hypothetical protein M421DRAFT_309322 [Didymella exigua CBS 183.55]
MGAAAAEDAGFNTIVHVAHACASDSTSSFNNYSNYSNHVPVQPQRRIRVLPCTRVAVPTALSGLHCKRPPVIQRALQRLRPASSPEHASCWTPSAGRSSIVAAPISHQITKTLPVHAPARCAHRVPDPRPNRCSLARAHSAAHRNLTGSTERPKSQARSACWSAATSPRAATQPADFGSPHCRPAALLHCRHAAIGSSCTAHRPSTPRR